MKKVEKYNLAEELSQKFLKHNFRDLPTPLRILMYGKIIGTIEHAQHLKKVYGYKKLEKIWVNNKKVGSKSKEWNEEVE